MRPGFKSILFIIPSPFAFRQFMGSLVLHLQDQQVAIHVICKEYTENVYIPGVRYHFVDFERNLSFSQALSVGGFIRKVVREVKPDIIHSHFSVAAFVTFLAKNRNWPKSVATIQGA